MRNPPPRAVAALQITECVPCLRGGCFFVSTPQVTHSKSQRTARTYGRLERLDVAAAVDYLAGRPTVDSARIAVWGVGSGAEAAQMAPSNAQISLLLAESRADGINTPNLDTRFMPAHWSYNALRPVCRWLFDVGFAGGAPPATGTKPGRTVEINFGDMQRALIELNDFASESLVLHEAK